MPQSTADLIRPSALRAAVAHRPKGFTAEVSASGDSAAMVVIRYCWYNSPWFEVEAEVIMVADETMDAIRLLGDFQFCRIEYLADHIVTFRAERLVPGSGEGREG